MVLTSEQRHPQLTIMTTKRQRNNIWKHFELYTADVKEMRLSIDSVVTL